MQAARARCCAVATVGAAKIDDDFISGVFNKLQPPGTPLIVSGRATAHTENQSQQTTATMPVQKACCHTINEGVEKMSSARV